MQKKGVQLMLETVVERIRKTEQGLELSLRDGSTLDTFFLVFDISRTADYPIALRAVRNRGETST